MPSRVPVRWVAIAVFTLSAALNYLGRQLLPALAPQVRGEFGLSNADYGLLLSAFSITYAASAPLAGLFIDRVGLNPGISIAVGLWSLAGVGTGLVGSFVGLLWLRAGLGVAQSGGIPASGKAAALYLPPQERALGTAATQIGLSAGAISAPLVASWLAAAYGWRFAFIAAGALGFLWIPWWLFVARRVPPEETGRETRPASVSGMLADRRLWGLVTANVLYMTVYSLWSNWTTVYLVDGRGLTQDEANRTLAWIPPIFANLGGLAGGWLALRWIRGGAAVLVTRMKVSFWSALLLLLTAAVPYVPGAGLATALVCLSFFSVTAMSVNVYAMPLDIFGAKRAAFAVSALTCAYGVMQTAVSPGIGALIDRYGFEPVCAVGAVLPLLAVAVLRFSEGRP